MEIKNFDFLPDDAVFVRTTVFIKEQGFENELDGNDKISRHIVIYDGEKPVATCRVFFADGKYKLGRVAVLKDYRGNGFGRIVCEAAEEYVREKGGETLHLNSQLPVIEFYKKLGYETVGDIFLEEEVEHIAMVKKIIL